MIAGVRVRPLHTHPDDRGTFTEIFRREWGTGVDPIQWNVVRSQAGVLRGVHVHPTHDDYLIVIEGRATIGLADLRGGSATEGERTTVELRGDDTASIVIPHGVAHGFLFHEPSIHVYSVSHYWDLADELACHWADPDLGIDWPATPRLVSDRDATAQTLNGLLDELSPYQPIG